MGQKLSRNDAPVPRIVERLSKTDRGADRIERAKYLLTSSSLKMSEIAQQCGFASASYFARIFRNAEDISPAEYRQQTQQTKPQ